MKDKSLRGETPRYAGNHRELTEEQVKEFEAEGRIPSIRFRVPADRDYTFKDIVKDEVAFHSNDFGDFIVKRMEFQLITLQ